MIASILTLILTFFLNIFSKPYVPPPPIKIATPSAIILETPKKPVIIDNTPWGTTEKVGEHLYRTYVGADPTMGTPEEILKALNVYRKNHGTGELSSDEKLCTLAQKRAETQANLGNLDSHKGLTEYLNDPKHWEELGVTSIGENASQGYVLSGVHLIEWVFDADSEHRSNQLSPHWTLACAGISETTVDIIFGKK